MRLRNEFDQIGKRHAARMGRRERSQQVEDVHLAGQTRSDFGRARRRFEIEHRAAGSERVACGAPVALADSIGANLGAGLARCRSQLFARAGRAR